MPNRWKWWWIGAWLFLVGHGAQAQQSFWPSLPGKQPNGKETADGSPSRQVDSASLPPAWPLRSALGGRLSEDFKQPEGERPSDADRNPAQASGELAPASPAKGTADTAKGSAGTTIGLADPARGSSDPAKSASDPGIGLAATTIGRADSARGLAEGSPPDGASGLSAGSLGQEGTDHVSASGRQPVRLGPQQKGRPLSSVSGSRFDPTASTLTVLSSLAVVLGVFLLLVWAIRRAMPRSSQLLPSDVLEVLGRSTLMGKHQMFLVRFGPKLLLLSVTTEGADTLTEIDHPDEVARIVALCRQNQPGSIPGGFRQILDQMSRQKSPAGAPRRSSVLPDEPAEPFDSANLPQQEPAHV